MIWDAKTNARIQGICDILNAEMRNINLALENFTKEAKQMGYTVHITEEGNVKATFDGLKIVAPGKEN